MAEVTETLPTDTVAETILDDAEEEENKVCDGVIHLFSSRHSINVCDIGNSSDEAASRRNGKGG